MSLYNISLKEISATQNKMITACDDLVNQYKNNADTEIILDFNDCEFLYPDYALLLLCALKYIEHSIAEVKGKIVINKNSKIANYLTRMCFFDNLKISLPYKFSVENEKSSVQIQKYNAHNQLDVLKKIVVVLKEKSKMHNNVFASLDYCFNEILDNVLNHSEKKEGWVVAQHFDNLNSIRLMVADYGVGIHKSLNLKHDFTEEEALLKCIEEGVTNGKGQGHGLYATATFIKSNKGWLSVISGNKRLNVSEKQTVVKDIDYWQGTCVYLRINTNVDVDYKEFTSKNYDYKKELFEDLFGNSNDIT